jgi:hypothetical protein
VHVLRHGQQQPDAARGDGPARARRRLRHPHDGLRGALTAGGGPQRCALTRGRRDLPIGQLVDERSIVNAMAALLATGARRTT